MPIDSTFRALQAARFRQDCNVVQTTTSPPATLLANALLDCSAITSLIVLYAPTDPLVKLIFGLLDAGNL